MKKTVYVILDNIRSALNTGSIFRTSETAGIDKLFLCGITPYPPHSKLAKTALGTIEHVNWEYQKSAIEVIHSLKKEGFTIISVEVDPRAVPYSSIRYPEKTCLIMGHELIGVNQDILNESDYIAQIPMHGEKNSLNVAVSYGIVVYESIRHQ